MCIWAVTHTQRAFLFLSFRWEHLHFWFNKAALCCCWKTEAGQSEKQVFLSARSVHQNFTETSVKRQARAEDLTLSVSVLVWFDGMTLLKTALEWAFVAQLCAVTNEKKHHVWINISTWNISLFLIYSLWNTHINGNFRHLLSCQTAPFSAQQEASALR